MPKNKRGRPPSLQRKIGIHLRLDPDVLAFWRGSGPGWQTRINDTLRRAMAREAARAAAERRAKAKRLADDKRSLKKIRHALGDREFARAKRHGYWPFGAKSPPEVLRRIARTS